MKKADCGDLLVNVSLSRSLLPVHQNHRTALHVAAQKGCAKIAAFLLANGANVDAIDKVQKGIVGRCVWTYTMAIILQLNS